MIQSIKLLNFKCFSNLRLDLGSLTLLSGLNGAGKRLGAALNQEKPGSIIAAAFRFCLLTGCRPGEALAARWDAIDLSARRWNLGEAKTGPRAVYLGQAAVDVITGLEQVGPFVFNGRFPETPLNHLAPIWDRLVARAEFPDGLRLYDATRHTFATTAAELEVPRDVRKRLTCSLNSDTPSSVGPSPSEDREETDKEGPAGA